MIQQNVTSGNQGDMCLFETQHNHPREMKKLQNCTKLTEEFREERKNIILKLKEKADYLEKTHSDVLIADRVGTGVEIGSGILALGGLVAAPFTAGLSLGLTATGITTGIAGGLTSAGANLSGYFLSKKSIDLLQKELDQHNFKIEKFQDLISNSSYIKNAIRLRPTIKQLRKLSEKGLMELILIARTLVSHALKGNHAQINHIINLQINPLVKNLLHQLPLDRNAELLRDLALFLTQIIKQLDSIWDSIKAFVNHQVRPELYQMAVIVMRSAKAIADDATEAGTAFKGTPLVMSRTARVGAGVLTASLIIVDIIHMVHICQEPGETPTVKKLRNMATQLEKEFEI